MSTYSIAPMLRRCLFAVLCMVLSTALLSSTGYAQEKCADSDCKTIKVFNTTGVKQPIRFLLCCNGEPVVTECSTVPAGTSEVEFPAGCTVLKVGFCPTDMRRPCMRFLPDQCVLRIFNCLGVDNESDDSDF